MHETRTGRYLRGALVALLYAAGFGAQCAQISIDSVSAKPGATAIVPIRFAAEGSQVAALQFDITCDSALTLSAVSGTTTVGGDKNLYTVAVSPRLMRFLVAGLNQSVIGDGTIASVSAAVSSSATAEDHPLKLANVSVSDPDGNSLSLSSTDGAVTVSEGTTELTSGMFPYVLADEGWKTSLTLLNAGAGDGIVKLTVWDGDGTATPLSMSFSSEVQLSAVTSASTELVIPKKGMAVVDLGPASDGRAFTGWIRMLASSGVTGWATLRNGSAGSQSTEMIVPLEARNPGSFGLPFDNTTGLSTGVAMANGSGTAATISVTARDAGGNTLLAESIVLPAHGHRYFLLADSYPALAGVRGSVEFQNQGEGSLAVVAVRTGPLGMLTAVPAQAR